MSRKNTQKNTSRMDALLAYQGPLKHVDRALLVAPTGSYFGALPDVRQTMKHSQEGKNKFSDVLGRFAAAADAREDAPVGTMATQMQDQLA